MRRRSAVLPTLAAVAMVTCGGKVVFEQDDAGGGGAPGTSSSVISAGPGTSQATSTVGPGPGPGPSVVSSSASGPEGCATCSEFVSGESFDELCPGSAPLYDELVDCICFAACAIDCEDDCNGAAPTPECEDCYTDKCAEPIAACLNDF
jgi:hypothetical protein